MKRVGFLLLGLLALMLYLAPLLGMLISGERSLIWFVVTWQVLTFWILLPLARFFFRRAAEDSHPPR